MLPVSGSFQSAKVRILMRRRGSGTTGGRFFVRMLRLGIRSKRSIVAALIDRILWRISSSSFKCPLRSSAGNRMGSSALRPLERWASMGLPALRLRRAVQDTDCRLFVIPRRRYELLQDPALILTRCGRIVGEFHAHGMHHLHLHDAPLWWGHHGGNRLHA